MNGPAPLYQQVKDHVLAHIQSGAWPVDFRVPSENELVRALGISRMTVNRAIRELTDQGVLRRVQGLGTFVADPTPQSEFMRVRNLAVEIAERGHEHSADVLALWAGTADTALATAMDLPVGARVFRSRILHREDGRPLQLEDRAVNPAIAPDYLEQDFTRTPPHAYLIECAPHYEAEHTVSAVMPDAETRRLLDMAAQEPCLLLHRRTRAPDGVVTVADLYHPGSRYRLGSRFTHSPRREDSET